jgi:hypothetical protein
LLLGYRNEQSFGAINGGHRKREDGCEYRTGDGVRDNQAALRVHRAQDVGESDFFLGEYLSSGWVSFLVVLKTAQRTSN